MSEDRLLTDVRAALVAVAEPGRAGAMQRYMKSTLPYHGVPLPVLRATVRPLVRGLAFPTLAALRAQVEALWFGATHREERYVALALLRDRGQRRYVTAQALPLYERLIVTGAWWDLVDEVATHLVRGALEVEPEPTAKVLRRWSRSQDLWLRRAAIISQVGRKGETDLALLFEVAEPAVAEKDFFLRKGLGWALRAVGPYQPKAVERWLQQHEGVVAGLTRREALKGLDPKRRP